MKKNLLIIICLLFGLNLFSQDKKAIKKLEKKYNVAANGKPLSSTDKIALLSSNLRFKLASRETAQTSNKAETWTKFGAYAVLEGVSDEVFQSISDEYETMLVKRFDALGMKVIPYEEIEQSKNFEKLKEKGLKDNENIKKSWGHARTFTAQNREYLVWNYAAPFGPHLKIAKELKALLFSSMVTIDFCAVGVEVSQSTSGYYGSSSRSIYTEGKSSVVPVVLIDGYTYPTRGLDMGIDNSINVCSSGEGKSYHTKLDMNQSEIFSEVDFALSTEMCKGCVPEFSKGRIKIMEHSIGTVVIKADPQLYKKAVLDALDKYLNEIFTLYAANR